VTALLTRLTTRVVDIRHRPGVGTVYAHVNALTGVREVTVHLVDAVRPDERLRVPADRVRLLDDCWTAAAARALISAP
jgi:hypothetical protein